MILRLRDDLVRLAASGCFPYKRDGNSLRR
jgi:hypothetical protein